MCLLCRVDSTSLHFYARLYLPTVIKVVVLCGGVELTHPLSVIILHIHANKDAGRASLLS